MITSRALPILLLVAVYVASGFANEPLGVDANGNRLPNSTDNANGDRVYLAIRTDEKAGSGSENDPFDASSASKFDALMARFWETHGARYVNGQHDHGRPLTIHLGRGIFETASLSSYGPNAGGYHRTQHWLAKGWTLRGSGIAETEIRNANPFPSGVTMFNSTGGTWGGPESGEITISDLTLNPQKTAHEDLAGYEVTISSADGSTSTATKPNHGWVAGTRIEISSENYNGATGPWDGGGWKLISAVTADTFSWQSKNRGVGEVSIKRVGEWNAVRLNGASNRVERVRVINAGANSIVETWPLWVGGDNSIVDSCVIERCSGVMSAIGMFPGTNRTIRNCVVDAAGTIATLGVSAIENVENCTIRNATIGVYADTFASSVPLNIRNNVIENASLGGIVIRPYGATKNIVVSGNRVHGGAAQVGVWIDPLSVWTGTEWHDSADQKIWIENVVVTKNDFGDKRIEMAQTCGVTLSDNITHFGAFYRMPLPDVVSGNRTPTGEEPVGLETKRTPDAAPTSSDSPR